MTEPPRHPEDELVELALGEVGEPRRSQLIRHLVDCHTCRAEFEAIAIAVDAVIPAAPRIEPPVGFDQRVLTTMGATEGSGPGRRRGRGFRTGIVLAVAAALLAAVVGGVGALSIWGDDDTTTTTLALAGDTAPLRTSDGETVGTASMSYLDGDPVVVVSITRPAVGIPYTCRLLMKNRTYDAGRWTVDDPDGSTWITRGPRRGHVVGMELVTDDGRVWSSARLP